MAAEMTNEINRDGIIKTKWAIAFLEGKLVEKKESLVEVLATLHAAKKETSEAAVVQLWETRREKLMAYIEWAENELTSEKENLERYGYG